jgi:hypothetical protein
MICVRCDKQIGQDEEYRRVDNDRPTGPPLNVYVHTKRCPQAPQQTYPAHRFSL